MAHVSSVTVAGRVFKGRHQLMSITILNTAVGVASLAYPYILSWLTGRFGLSGTYLILGGITCNTFLLFIVCFINRKALTDGPSEQSQTSTRAIDGDVKTTRSSTNSTDGKEEIPQKTSHDVRDGKTVDIKYSREEGTLNLSYIDDRSDTDPRLNNDDKERIDTISDGKYDQALDIIHVNTIYNNSKINDMFTISSNYEYKEGTQNKRKDQKRNLRRNIFAIIPKWVYVLESSAFSDKTLRLFDISIRFLNGYLGVK